MTKFKKILTIAIVILVIGITGVVFASDFRSPQDIVARLTGKTVEQILQEREAGKTFGIIAKENDKLDEFKAQMIVQKKAVLDQRVKDEVITQEQADQIYSTVKTNQAICDGTGQRIGNRSGAGFGRMNGGVGLCDGSGMESGRGLNR